MIAANLEAHQSTFGLRLSGSSIARLVEYYELVQGHNPLLHLVAPCSPEEFAVRHILESLTLLEYLPQNAKFADVGAGAGLPSLPCLLVRNDLSAILVESNQKKGRFLELAVEHFGLADRATVINRQFEEADIEDCEWVTARALDKFTERLPRLLKWGRGKKMLLFGGPNLETALNHLGAKFSRRLLAMSAQRYLFITE